MSEWPTSQYVIKVCEHCGIECPQMVQTYPMYPDKPYDVLRCTICQNTGERKV